MPPICRRHFLFYGVLKSAILLLTFFINKFWFKRTMVNIHVLQPVSQIVLYGVESLCAVRRHYNMRG
jgi:hypothetical protein